jgi:PTH1 family peptidyl-tRNA hydrolase
MPGQLPWLVVGLGNPGSDYAGNRHNVGFMVADVLAARDGDRFKASKNRAVVLQTRLAGQRVVLAKPNSYMNESGGPVAGLASFFDVAVPRIIVIHDELDLDYGTLRVKRGGGDNGHNGLRSITKSVASKQYLRVRFGIGRPPGRQDPADFVLSNFSAAERKDLAVNLEAAADAVVALIEGGPEALPLI